MWLFIVAGIGFLLINTIYFSDRHYRKQLKIKLAAREAEIKQLSLSAQTMQHAYSEFQKKLQHAVEDPVTHLLGWQLFEDRLQQRLQECIRYQLTMAVMYIDINDFAVINNALGQEMGDAVLLAISQCLQSSIRKVDSISRYNKDVFVILLSQISKPEAAAIVALRVLQAISEPIQVKQQTIHVTANIGISIYPTDGETATILLQNADSALQIAKQNGRQHYQFYHQSTYVNSEREYLLSMGLKSESLYNELEIQYQPIMDVENKQIFCMEAVLSWRHPLLGLIQPNELQDHIERQGNESKITEWVLRKACQQFVNWRQVGFQPVLLGVTVSIKQLHSNQFIYHLSQLLKEYHFQPEWLLLELTSQPYQHELAMLEKTFNMLHYLNVKLAINHFCSTPLSIHYLNQFPVQYAKIDSSLIEDIEQNNKNKTLLEGMVYFSHSLSMELIVQGVDSEQQMMTLNALGCRLMQGRFVEMPILKSEPSPV